jgi:hypothetical protein
MSVLLLAVAEYSDTLFFGMITHRKFDVVLPELHQEERLEK